MSKLLKDLDAVHKAFLGQRQGGSTSALLAADGAFIVVMPKKPPGNNLRNRILGYDQLGELRGSMRGPIALDNEAVIDLVARSSEVIRYLQAQKRADTDEIKLLLEEALVRASTVKKLALTAGFVTVIAVVLGIIVVVKCLPLI